ncbi:hypothetical protein B0E45_30350 [Sinorhizobium sp. A49]|uniref:hypothetical protein n=1 Tax=Sinorhizobium sp. A49 TaxID=1945861 RepID=UPI000984A1E3|nr:hypothetical protein [Sinorhizobium sp. A49]OOG62726.1 hypothetical protein B0E45_30350 [Sinorhizobium sp. A49]
MQTNHRPLQNRVTPFGEIVAMAQRGLFTGNRGIIHDPATKTLLRRRWSSKAWLICACDYGVRRRDVMAGRSWTELFFLDEAVALAAGHRPCFFCRREAALGFRAAWAGGSKTVPSAGELDAVLHDERQSRGQKRVHPLPSPAADLPAADLPDGTVAVAAGAAFTVASGRYFRWTETGYLEPEPDIVAEGVLTPPSTVSALRAGYRPVLHPDIAKFLSGSPS